MIRLFISSTFSDMGTERDVIHQDIYPVLREYGLSKGVPIDICDLRWGVDPEENDDKLKQIMDVCFREVENCEPYIVSMIGSRYGTKADPKTQEKIKEIWRALGRGDDLPEKTEISLTQWELEYAFLSNHNKKVRALCLFKKDVSAAEDGVDDLKERIRAKQKDPEYSDYIRIREYPSEDEDFRTIFIKEIKEFIDERAAAYSNENPAKREFAVAEAYSELKASLHCGREREEQQFKQFLNSEDKSILLYHGNSGIGKSTLLAKLFHDTLETETKCRLITCGASEFSCEYLNLLKQIVFALEEYLYKEEAKYRSEIVTVENAEEVFVDVLKRASSETTNGQFVLFVDALDKVENGRGDRLRDLLLEHLHSGNIKIVGSQIEIKDVKAALQSNLETMKINRLTDDDIRSLLQRKLFSSYQKIDKENNPVIREIMNKSAAAEPLYLDIVVSCLKMHMAEADDLNERNQLFIDKINAMPDSTKELIRRALLETIEYLGIDKKRMVDGIGLIALSKYGLREETLQSILGEDGWIPLEFSRLRAYLHTYFRQQNSGAWVFEHDIIREGLKKLLDSEERTDLLRRRLYDFLLNHSCQDIELIAREALWLNQYYDDYEYAGVLLWMLTDYPRADRFAIRTIVANELEELSAAGGEWFSELTNRYEMPVMKLLRDLLELYGSEDYARQYPAMILTDLFFKRKGFDNTIDNEAIAYELNQWIAAMPFADQFSVVSFVTEYCNILESCGRHLDATGFAAFAIDFYLDNKNIGKMSGQQRMKAFKNVNSLFFTNNKIINGSKGNVDDLKERSEAVISSYEDDLLDIKRLQDSETIGQEIREIDALYTSNIGQYRNAMKEFDKALEYHFESFLKKANNFFDAYENDALRVEFFDMIERAGIKNNDVTDIHRLLELDLDQQMGFWKKVEDVISHEDVPTINSIKESWKVIGVNYRNTGWDRFDYQLEKGEQAAETYDKWIDFACKSMEISIRMLSSTVFGIVVREQIVSRIRWIALQNKKRDEKLSKDFFESLTGQIEDTVKKYLDYSTYVGEKERDNLAGNIKATLKKIEGKPYDAIKQRLERLKGKLEELKQC